MSDDSTPSVRFDGFTNDWEQRKASHNVPAVRFMADDGSDFPAWEEIKIGGIGEVITGSTPSTKHDEYFGDEILWATPVDLNDQLVLKNTARKLSKLGYSKVRKLPEGSVLVSCIASIGKVGVLPVPGSCNQQINAVIPEADIDSYWLGYAMLPKKPTLEMLGGNGGLKIVNKTLFENMHIFVPSLPEQQKIASCLSSVDKTLTLCRRKLDLLTQAKKALIYNLFPRKGESVPRFRLAGFSGTWTLEHVGKFLTESFEKGHTGNEAQRLTVKLWGKGIEPKNSPFTGSSNTQYYVRHAGQLMYGKLDFLHAAFGIVPSELDGWESTLDSPAFDVKDANPYFLLYIFLQPEFYLHHGQIANGSRKAKRIHPALFFQMPIRIPSRDEQDAIVKLLSSADALIDQARVELEQWQEVKKSLLQQMFV